MSDDVLSATIIEVMTSWLIDSRVHDGSLERDPGATEAITVDVCDMSGYCNFISFSVSAGMPLYAMLQMFDCE